MSKEQGFYLENTIEIEIDGVKTRVNKFEADKLAKKLKAKSTKKEA